MWVYSREGFFSVSKDRYCKEDEVVVRARIKQDLLNLRIMLAKKFNSLGQNRFGKAIAAAKIMEFDHADYRYRIIIKHDFWTVYAREAAMDIDYPTVKDHIVYDHAVGRTSAYYSCWNAMHYLQEDPN